MNKAITGFVFAFVVIFLVIIGLPLASYLTIWNSHLGLLAIIIVLTLVLVLYVAGIIFSIQGLKTDKKVFGIIALVLYGVMLLLGLPLLGFVMIGVLGGIPGI